MIATVLLLAKRKLKKRSFGTIFIKVFLFSLDKLSTEMDFTIKHLIFLIMLENNKALFIYYSFNIYVYFLDI